MRGRCKTVEDEVVDVPPKQCRVVNEKCVPWVPGAQGNVPRTAVYTPMSRV